MTLAMGLQDILAALTWGASLVGIGLGGYGIIRYGYGLIRLAQARKRMGHSAG